MKKRLLSIALCICMVLSLLPTVALATAGDGTTSGTACTTAAQLAAALNAKQAESASYEDNVVKLLKDFTGGNVLAATIYVAPTAGITLDLAGYSFTGANSDDASVPGITPFQVVDNSQTFTVQNGTTAASAIKGGGGNFGGNGVTGTLTIGGTGAISISGGRSLSQNYSGSSSGVEGNVTISAGGAVTITGGAGISGEIVGGSGVTGNVVITGAGTVNILGGSSNDTGGNGVTGNVTVSGSGTVKLAGGSSTYGNGGKALTGTLTATNMVVKDSSDNAAFAAVTTAQDGTYSSTKRYLTVTPAVSYLDASGDSESCEEYTTVESTTTTWSDGIWYVVSSDITISSRITVSGEVHLILVDGKTLTASSGITVATGNSLTIYGQSGGTGTLTATGSNGAGIGGYDGNGNNSGYGGTVKINGGKVTATGGNSAAGIGGAPSGAGGSVTINGGTVTANGGNSAAGIGGGSYCGSNDQGSLTVVGGMVVKGDSNANPETVLNSPYNSRPQYMTVTPAPFDDCFGTANLTATSYIIDNQYTFDDIDYTFVGWFETGVYGEYTGNAVSSDFVAGRTYYAKWTVGGNTVRIVELDLSEETGTIINTDEGWAWNGTIKTLTLSGMTLITSDKIAVSLPAGTTIVLTANTVNTVIGGDDTAGNDTVGIRSFGDLTINGSGTLSTTAGDTTGGYGLGIASVGTLTINDGIVTANGGAISEEEAKSAAFYAGGNIIINGGTLTGNGGSISGAGKAYSSSFLTEGGTITLGTGVAITTPDGGKVSDGGYIVNSDGTTIASSATITYTTPYTPTVGSSTPTVTVPVTSEAGSAEVSATVSGGTASVTVTDKQLESVIDSARQTGTVRVDVSGAANINAAKIPAKVVKATAESNTATGLQVSLPTGSVKLDAAAVSAVSGGTDVTISVENVRTSDLTATQKETLGDRLDSAVVVDVNVLIGGVKQRDFNGGKVTVSMPYTPKEGEDTGKLTVWYIRADGSIENVGGTYDAASGCFVFTTTHLSQYVLLSENSGFTDVRQSDWFYDEVMNVVANGWCTGVTHTGFLPNSYTTRGMIATIVHRMEGEPAGAAASAFEDVASGAYYANGVNWAQANGVVSGYGNGKFGPQDAITREQLAAVLYRYAQYKGYDVTKTAGLDAFSDAGSVSAYAADPVKWAVANGLITGKPGGILDPTGQATRAQVAAVLTRFDKVFAR